MRLRPSKQRLRREGAVLCSLPNDILAKIIRPLSFQEKCSLELVSRGFHAILSNSLPAEGLWGKCDLLSDTNLEANFNSKEDVMRWLKLRLPCFTHLICDTTGIYSSKQSRSWNFDSTSEAAEWLVTELRGLSSAIASGCHLQLVLTTDMTKRLFKAQPDDAATAQIQDDYWAAMSHSLTELEIFVSAADEPIRMAVLTQLSKLTSLRMGNTGYNFYNRPASYVLDLPGVTNLHLRNLNGKTLTLICPGLRRLDLVNCRIYDQISLQAPLEKLCCLGGLGFRMHEAFPLSNLLGLTSLQCDLSGKGWHSSCLSVLPSLSRLLSLTVRTDDGLFPPVLPASLRTIKYFVSSGSVLDPKQLLHMKKACQLPELQCITLRHLFDWEPDFVQAFKIFKGDLP